MRILLSGATGFIGRKLGLELVKSGHEVVAVVRNSGRARRDLPFPCEILEWGEAPENIDAVVHLAGESIAGGRWTRKRKERILRSRTETTRALVDLLPKILGRKPRVMVGASAIGYYGDRGDEVLSETAAPSGSFLGEVCRRWEEELLRARESCPRVVAIRIGVVLGREGGALAEILPLFKLGVAGVLGNGRQWMSWIHWRDLVGIFVRALSDENVRGVFNGVAPEPVTNREFTRAVAEAVKAPVFLPAPAWGLRALLGEMSAILLSSQRCSSAAMDVLGFKFQFPELKIALADLCGRVEGAHGRFTEEWEEQQWVPSPIQSVFPFFSDAGNLRRITPPWLHFRVLRVSDPVAKKDTEIEYQIRVHGIPLRWKTVISKWEEGDSQAGGFCALWNHIHEFEGLGGGTWMRDRLAYRLPLGWLGYVLGGRLVAGDVRKIFSFRRSEISRLFPARNG